MPKKKSVILRFEPDGMTATFEKGITILDALRAVGLPIRSECGGRGICGKCKVIVQDPSRVGRITDAERTRLSNSELKSNYRLACSCRVTRDTTIFIPRESRITERKILVEGIERQVTVNSAIRKVYIQLPEPALSDIRSDVQRLMDSLRNIYGIERVRIDYPLLKTLPQVLRDSNWRVTVTVWDDREVISMEPGDTTDIACGVAVDIGTSKIISYLSDLITGELIGVGFSENPQVCHGEDVISRISYVSKGEEELDELQRLAVNGVNTVIDEACKKSKRSPQHIYEITVVGNTAMHHIFLGLQPMHLGLSPYVPAISDSVDIKARDLALKVNPCANIHVLPIIAGFVGADAVADIISTGIYESDQLSLVVDIGTNTEVILGDKHGMMACSCASGPAFEGAHIKCGMKATTGAIERLWINPENYEVAHQTIGKVKPIGLCGSAIIDGIADFLRYRIIDGSGKFNISLSTPRLRTINAETEFVLVFKGESNVKRDIVITQRDIREIQLAKAAIYTGCYLLMKRKNIEPRDIKKCYIAGAFGNYLNPENAKLIGMFPDILKESITFVGNAAGAGARMTLISKEYRRTASLIPRKVQYLELASDPDFQREFASAMYFPHKDLDRFPSVKEYLMELGKDVQI